MSNYVRLTKGVKDQGILIKPEEINDHVKDQNKDHYVSIHQYNQDHYNQFQQTKSIAGIKDVKTNILAFDFDCKEDLTLARKDALTLIARLKDTLKIKPSSIERYFSGQKGFTILVRLNRMLTPDQVSHIALNILGKDLKTLDASLYNASRILRLPNTKHQESGLFKIALSPSQLESLNIETIKKNALEPQRLYPAEKTVDIPDEMLPKEKAPEVVVVKEYGNVDYSKKPYQWKNCKWSLAQGNFKNGERHTALTVIAATCRGLGFTKEMTFDLCKGALERSIAKFGQGTTDEEELFNNILKDVFGDNWEGGSFTCKKSGWLQNYCNSLGEHKCKDRDVDDKPFVQFDDMFEGLLKFSKDFEKNIIKTGIKELDKQLILSTSTLNGLLGQPGAGKTTMAMNYLKHSSKMGIPSAFFSLDMGAPIVTAKIIQQRTGDDFIKVLEFCKNQPTEAKLLAGIIKKEDYANVNFNFRSGLQASDMKELIRQQEEVIGKKVKLVIIDYLECLAGPYADQTANTGFIANQLKDLANELEVCILLLLQTQKHSTPDISDPLMSLKGVKGSSVIEQSCTTILTLWREGYSPKFVEDDKYISFAVVKNRFGSLWSGDFSWNPVTGDITGLTEEQKWEFDEFKKRKRDEKIAIEAVKSAQWS